VRSKLSYKSGGSLSLEEVSRTDIPGTKYTIIVYDAWEPNVPKDDPSTSLERRMAIFVTGKEPADGMSLKIPRDHWRFDGLEGAIADEVVEILREADREAQRLLQEEQQMLSQGRRFNYTTSSYEDTASEYENFLQAIERVADDDQDDDAWTTIEQWRERQMRHEDRASRL
jgi:hypothetical protein